MVNAFGIGYVQREKRVNSQTHGQDVTYRTSLHFFTNKPSWSLVSTGLETAGDDKSRKSISVSVVQYLLGLSG